MAVADEAVERKASVAHAPTLIFHSRRTAAAPHPSLQSSARLQLALIHKALLADVTEKNPDASYIELLRLCKVRRSVADGH